MSKHTPGPWELRESAAAGRKVVASPRLGLIAILAEHDVGEAEWIQDEANARLIAAAPDLLAACKALLPMAEDDLFQYGGGLHAGDSDPTILAARAAIAKAEGK